MSTLTNSLVTLTNKIILWGPKPTGNVFFGGPQVYKPEMNWTRLLGFYDHLEILILGMVRSGQPYLFSMR